MNLRSVIVLITVSVILAGSAARAAAQRGPSKVQATTVTLTGCVAQGIDVDHYVLANAVRREEPPASTAIAGRSPTVRSDNRGASDRTGPYDLQGGEFKAHLGQMVEVTGTGGSIDKTPATAPIEKPLPRLNVLSVKTLAATCS